MQSSSTNESQLLIMNQNYEFTLAMYYVDIDLNNVNKKYLCCLNIKILYTSKCIGICDGAAAIMEVLIKSIYRRLKIHNYTYTILMYIIFTLEPSEVNLTAFTFFATAIVVIEYDINNSIRNAE